jgi:hypothetical protein
MIDDEAIRAAVKLYATPASLRLVRTAPLPTGMTGLLLIAAGDADRLRIAAYALGRAEDHIRDAVMFFVTQVVFAPEAGAHRVLGCAPDAIRDQLKTHRSLLLNWLHPDRHGAGAPRDRVAMANRVIDAWRFVSRDEVDCRGTTAMASPGALVQHQRRRSLLRRVGSLARPKPNALGR